MNILDGKLVSNEILTGVKEKIDYHISQSNDKIGYQISKPSMAIVLVGNNPASESYVKGKLKACDKAGINHHLIRFDESISAFDLLTEVKNLNKSSYDGFIVQLPLPSHIKPDPIINEISAYKDIDGFHPLNFGKMALGQKSMRPATAYGILKLIEYYNIDTKGKHVVVIGGGDTGSDCVGTSNRHGAASVTQFELMPQPPAKENKELVWPNWPLKLRTSSSHEEGCDRDWSVTTKELIGENGKVTALKGARVEWKDGKMTEVPGSEFTIKADLVLLAMGFVSPVQKVLDAFGVEKDQRGNAKATTDGNGCYKTSKDKVFAAGDMRRGQSLVVWAIREGRQCARAVDEFLMGSSTLPR